jgi:hypothetical protein
MFKTEAPTRSVHAARCGDKWTMPRTHLAQVPDQCPEHLPSGVTYQCKWGTYAHLTRQQQKLSLGLNSTGGAQSRGNSVLFSGRATLIGGAAASGRTGTGSES